MCGIAGILNWRGEPEELQAALERIQAAPRHRGADDQE